MRMFEVSSDVAAATPRVLLPVTPPLFVTIERRWEEGECVMSYGATRNFMYLMPRWMNDVVQHRPIDLWTHTRTNIIIVIKYDGNKRDNQCTRRRAICGWHVRAARRRSEQQSEYTAPLCVVGAVNVHKRSWRCAWVYLWCFWSMIVLYIHHDDGDKVEWWLERWIETSEMNQRKSWITSRCVSMS